MGEMTYVGVCIIQTQGWNWRLGTHCNPQGADVIQNVSTSKMRTEVSYRGMELRYDNQGQWK